MASKTAEMAAGKTNSDQAVKAGAKYPLERLRDGCVTRFGVGTAAFDGATYGLTGEYTVDELKAIIAAWQGKKVTK